MRVLKKLLAVYIALVLMVSMIPRLDEYIFSEVNAAGSLVVGIATGADLRPLLSSDSVTLRWEKVDNAVSYVVYYRDTGGNLRRIPENPADTINPDDYETMYIDCRIDGLSKDFIYQFKVIANMSGGGTQQYTKCVLTGTTFHADSIPETPQDLPGGGKETGANPGLRFRWKMPQIWSKDDVEDWDGAVVSADPGKIDYDIYLGTDGDGLNRTKLKVRYNTAGEYIVTRAKNNKVKTVAESVHEDAGYLEFDCYGGDDAEKFADNNNYPDFTWNPPDNDTGFDSNNIGDFSIVPSGSAVNLSDIYKNPDLTPGTVLRMSIEPYFNENMGDTGVSFLRSTVSGGFTYTPVRFRLNRDSSNNLVATIFKINQVGKDVSDLLTFTYEVQYDTNPSFSNFITSARQTDEFSPGEDTMTIFIENKDFDTPFYYRVIAWSPNQTEVLYSGTIEYTLSQDTPQAPLPEDVRIVEVTAKSGDVFNSFYDDDDTPPGGDYSVQSADVKVRWKKPSNYDEIIEAQEDDPIDTVYYHIMLSTAQSDVPGQRGVISGIFGDLANAREYDVKYRDVYKINIAACRVVNENGVEDPNGSYLEYTFDGLKLFSTVDGDPPAAVQNLLNPDDYPTYLLPNRVYYIKMFSRKDDIDIDPPQSDSSIPASFTTPIGMEQKPPSPLNFIVLQNGEPEQNQHKPVVLEWDKINIDPSVVNAVYYDLYMSDSRDDDTFIAIGSALQNGGGTGDVTFSGLGPLSGIVDASISNFTSPEATGRFGSGLKPNTTYYFKVKTRVFMVGETEARESEFSRILTVTTLKGAVVEPPDSEMKPRVPQGFSVLEVDGNELLDSSTVTLTWREVETDVKYILIRTSLLINSDTPFSEIESNPEYKHEEYLSMADESFADPGNPNYDPNLTFNSETGVYTYKIDGLKPNTMYYFSLRAVREVDIEGTAAELYSSWVTITATTSLIEAPRNLTAVTGYEIGVSWLAPDIFTSDDFTVSINGRVVPRGEVFISEETVAGDDNRFYARIVSLQPAMSHTVSINGTATDGEGVEHTFGPYDISGAATATRDNMHELDVRWEGKDGYGFEIAIKGENDVDYTVLSENNGFIYTSCEKPYNMVDSDYTMYYARITSLKSNTRYYIKVRSVELNDTVYEYSRYDGPISTRTEFSQDDYDGEEQDNKERANYFDQVEKFKRLPYWEMGNSSGTYRIKVRGDIAGNIIRNSGSNGFSLDLAGPERSGKTTCAVYIPVSIIELLESRNENLVVRVPGSEYILRPDTVNAGKSEEILDMRDSSGVKEVYLYIEIVKLSKPSGGLPPGSTLLSDAVEFNAEAVGMRLTDAQIEDNIKDRLNRYIEDGLEDLQNTRGSKKDTPGELRDVIADIVEDIEYDLREYIEEYIEGGGGMSSKIRDTVSLASFDVPMRVGLALHARGTGTDSPYMYSGRRWEKLAASGLKTQSMMYFEAVKPAEYAVVSYNSPQLGYIPDSHWAKEEIRAFSTRYDISGLLDVYGSVDSSISVSDMVLVLEKILSPAARAGGSSGIAGKARELGLDNTINFSAPGRKLTRQELAVLVVEVYSLKSGASIGSLKPGRVVSINDENDIRDSCYKYVALSIDMKILSVDSDKNFRPMEACTKAQAIAALTRVLKILGELT